MRIPVLLLVFFCGLLYSWPGRGQYPLTRFEQSAGRQSATYQECIDFYKAMDSASEAVTLYETGPTDAGPRLHLVVYDPPGKPGQASAEKLNILVNNSIHPGEPDGMDACMLLLRDAVTGKIRIPANVRLHIIPVYNIGGALNRGIFSRVNQDGPVAYGFRGSAQNLDLNRDFTKNDSYEAMSFAKLFHQVKPHVFIDNHVSDGADYQHTITLLSTQYDKLGGELGAFMRDSLDPSIYRAMAAKGWPMIPYVNFESADPRKGWIAFYDPPRFSAGYAALFHTIAYTPETHMLKPFKQRVESTYELMRVIIRESSRSATAIQQKQQQDIERQMQQQHFALSWVPDTTRATTHTFLGYEPKYKTSEVTGQQRLYYDRSKPFKTSIPIHDHYTAKDSIKAPAAYVIPQGWHKVTDRLLNQGVKMQRLERDSVMAVTAYYVDDYKTFTKPYESHYKHYDVKVSPRKMKVPFRKGDYYIALPQPAIRFVIEMLEPTGDDSYFAWNFFDAVLQQKEGYSDYRWEDVAAAYLKEHPEVKRALEDRKRRDAAFAKDAAAQLKFVYQHSPWYEPEHLRYPVFRIERN